MDGGGRRTGSLKGTEPSQPAGAGPANAVSRRRRAERRGSGGVRLVDPPGRRRGINRWFDRMADRISRLPRRAGLFASIGIIATSAGYGAVRGGHTDVVIEFLRDARDMAANTVGFNIAAVGRSGPRPLNPEEIVATPRGPRRASLLFFDVADARARLKTNPWIAEATVQKLLPDRLVISITEREPFALWQKAGRVGVIAGDGTVLEPYVAAPYSNLPLVVGNGAEMRANQFLALLDRHPELRANVRASVLVADRRWNLWLRNGIDVRLPEFDVDKALDQLAALERDAKLSTRDITVIDLRLADRVTVQLSDAAAQARDEAIKKKQQKTKGGNA
jgi:cell division protein FtsQ